MGRQLELAHVGVGDPLAGFIAAAFETCRHAQAGGGDGAGDIAGDRVERAQRDAGPVEADEAEEPMLDRVPLRAAAGIMTYRHGEPAGVAQLFLELGFPDAGAAAIGAAGIGQDKQALGFREPAPSFAGLPVADRLDREAGRVEAVADAQVAGVARHLIDAVRDRLADRILGPVMHQYRLGFTAPGAASVPVITDQFLF